MRENKPDIKNEIVQMAILLFIVNYSVENFGTFTAVVAVFLLVLFLIASIFS